MRQRWSFGYSIGVFSCLGVYDRDWSLASILSVRLYGADFCWQCKNWIFGVKSAGWGICAAQAFVVNTFWIWLNVLNSILLCCCTSCPHRGEKKEKINSLSLSMYALLISIDTVPANLQRLPPLFLIFSIHSLDSLCLFKCHSIKLITCLFLHY